MPLLISEAEVRRLLSLEDLATALRHALAAYSNGESSQPRRVTIDLPFSGSFCNFMPALTTGMLGAKVESIFPRKSGHAVRRSDVLLWSPANGALEAVVAGRSLTMARTAAVSSLSVQALARTGASTLAILGSGSQARGHLYTLPILNRFQRILVWSPNPERLQALVRESGGRAEAATSAEAAVRWADVLVLATSSPVPVFSSKWVRPGAHVISLGALRPDQQEMDPQILPKSRLFVDSVESALTESGDVIQAVHQGLISTDHIRGELGELLAGLVIGRETPEDITIFKSTGLAVEDITAAALIYWKARSQGVGTDLPLSAMDSFDTPRL